MKMKRYSNVIAFILSLLVTTTSCLQDEVIQQTEAGKGAIQAVIEQSVGTRTAVTHKEGAFTWVAGDEIQLLLGKADGSVVVTPTPLTVTDGKGTFSLGDNKGVISAVYPAIFSTDDKVGENGIPASVTLPAEYTYGSVNAPMYAVLDGEGNTANFMHLAGVMAITLLNVSEDADRFVFQTDQQITGKFAVKTDKENPYIEVGTDAATENNSVTVKFGETVKNRAAMTFYIPLPVGEYKQFTVKLVGEKGEVYSKTADSSKANRIERRTLGIMPINQEDMGIYVPGTAEDIKDDIKVQVKSGYTSSFQSGSGIEKSFDGDMSTIYHSSWNNNGDNYFPITLEYYFEEGTNMDYFIYYPRPSGSNGHFKEVDIEVKSNANSNGEAEWKKVMSYDFKGSGVAARVDFPQAQSGVSAVRFIVKSGHGDRQGFAACGEMEFYQKNPENFEWSILFTDASCSELKPGVTEQDIVDCQSSIFQNIAFYLFYDKYPREFRIASFKAYPHPDEQSKTHKTNPYSLLDNPTGIAVQADEELIVLADLKGQTASLRVQNLDKAGGDGFGGTTYPLSEGINKIKIKEKGLVYVMYHTSDFESVPAVKLHFATGTVNGYYDSENEALKDRWQELLANAKDKYFDVLGKYAHLTFPTDRFRNHTKDLKRLIGYYDDIVHHQHLLMGLEKYNKPFHNRMYFNVMYHSYMYATSYHTGYHDNTLSSLCNDETLANNVWGPAHEVGHCNQTRPGLNWKGTTEVTNNIMSLYLQTTIFNADSRVQTELMTASGMVDYVASNRYARAWNGILVDRIAHVTHGDVFCRLIPFWQLELFMGKVNGKTPLQQDDKGGFYPDVYEHVRVNPNLPTAGEQQLEFVYIASLYSGYNLLDFFEKWGFLAEVDLEVDDYGKAQLTITKDMADAIRKRVEDLGYPKPDVAIEYISDNNYKYFKEKGTVKVGTSTREGNILTMRDWKNVIVYEVREASEDGRLIGVSEGVNTPSSTASFDVRGGWQDTYKVYAVQYDNKRIEVVFE